MNILFLSLIKFESIEDRGIYTDLLREFIRNGNNVFALSPIETKKKGTPHIIDEKQSKILKVPTGRIQKTNFIEKGINTILIGTRYKRAVQKYFGEIKFDLILYPTPPITLAGTVEYVKKRDQARTYLLLKDIFPQGAVDLGVLSKQGLKGLIYKYFRKKEKKLYDISDRIGCMSEANCRYVLKHNPEINPKKVEICPNCIEVKDFAISVQERTALREKYCIPLYKTVFVYGGNLGKPQGIPFLLECLKTQLENEKVYFLIAGDGTEYNTIATFFKEFKPNNMKLLKQLPKEEYDKLIAACDIGMIFLDHRFTIPNFPSRLLSYMQAKLPVLAVTDPNTDIGKIIVDGKFGWWCESNDISQLIEVIRVILSSELSEYKNTALRFLQNEYNVDKAYNVIICNEENYDSK